VASDFGDLIRSHACLVCNRGIVRLKDKKNFGAGSKSESDSQTPKAFDEETDSYTIAYRFA
jgi:hypothetical protein